MFRKFMLLVACVAFIAGCQTGKPGHSTMEMLDHYEKKQVEQSKAIEEGKPAEKAEKAEPEQQAEEAEAEVKAEEPQVVPEPVPEPIEPERKIAMILMKTSKGDIKIQLNEEKAPKTCENFLKYVEAGHYSGTIFHRVIDGFMIQGGGFDEAMNQKPAPDTVENEADNGLANNTGTIAMARTQDPHSASAQFFINVKDNAFLNHTSKDLRGWGYCVFGEVVEGMDVVNQIKDVPTGNAGYHQDVPKEAIVINEVIVVE